MEVVGTNGVLCVPDLWVPGPRAAFTIEREGQPTEKIVVEGEDQVQHMIEDFGRAVLEGKPVLPDPEEAVRTLRVLDAVAKSARENRIVDV